MLLFAQNLEYLISLKNVTLQALGKHVGVTHSTISNWRDGIQYPDVKKLVKLCEYFDIEPNDIILKDLTTGIDPKKLENIALPGNVSGSNLLVPAEAQSGYLAEWTADFIQKKLKYVNIPEVEGEARTFEVVENTMVPDLVPGEYVVCIASNLAEVQSGRVYAIVSDRIQVCFAQVEKDRVLCIPANKEEFEAYYIPSASIREVWEAKMKISNKVVDPLAGGYHPSKLRYLEEFLKGKFPDLIVTE